MADSSWDTQYVWKWELLFEERRDLSFLVGKIFVTQ
jgi:hypothetical protein